MIINQNMNALNVLNKLNAINRMKDNSIGKLSSGKRINKSADDPAGCTISEKMRNQIRGLEHASKNIQDATSFIQIADSAMQTIIDPNLIRLKELAVQSSNGTYSDSEREVIKKEVNNILDSIEDINDNTEMNTTKVFRPSNHKPIESKNNKTDIVFVIDTTGSMGNSINKVKNDINKLVDSLSGEGIDYNLGLIAYTDTKEPNSVVKYDITNNIDTFKGYIGSLKANGGGDMNESGLEAIADPTNGSLSYPMRDNSTRKFIMITDAPVHSISDGNSKYDISSVADDLKKNNISLDLIGSDVAKSQLNDTLVKKTGGKSFDIDSSNYEGILKDIANDIIKDKEEEDDHSGKLPPLEFQIGSQSGQKFTINRYDLGIENLGLKDFDLSNINSANKSIELVDEAINRVNKVLSEYGAYQNSLEHTYKSGENYNYNLTSAQSRITDVDMADGIMEFTKYDILEQAAQAMLVQSRKMTEAILNLTSKW